jgi:hypothetical protein
MQELRDRWVIVEVEPYYVRDLKSVALVDTSINEKKQVMETLSFTPVTNS